MRLIIKIIIFGLLLVLIVDLIQQANLRRRSQSLNLIIISIDALRPDHIGVYGYPKNTTPNIDKWSEDSFIFTNSITTIPWTYPSFASLMTGQNPLDTRILSLSDKISSGMPTLAKILKSVGYKNYAFVTNPNLSPDLNGIEMGFDNYKSLLNPQDNRDRYEKFLENGVDYVISRKGQKFFAWIHLIDPHAPYDPPEKYRCKFNTDYCKDISGKTANQLEVERYALTYCNAKVTKQQNELYQTLYDGNVAYSDMLVGKILDRLQQSNLDKNSIVVILSDHGEGFDHNYYFEHSRVIYDSGVKTVLMIKNPLVVANRGKEDKLVSNTDFLPTILDLLGISKEGLNLAGKSFSNLINKGIFLHVKSFFTFSKNYVFMQNQALTKFGVYDGKYKYIYSTSNDCLLNNQIDELYDISKDPKENNNIFNKQKKIGNELKGIMLRHLSKYNLPSIAPSQIKSSDVLKSLPNPNNENRQDLIDSLKSLGY